MHHSVVHSTENTHDWNLNSTLCLSDKVVPLFEPLVDRSAVNCSYGVRGSQFISFAQMIYYHTYLGEGALLYSLVSIPPRPDSFVTVAIARHANDLQNLGHNVSRGVKVDSALAGKQWNPLVHPALWFIHLATTGECWNSCATHAQHHAPSDDSDDAVLNCPSETIGRISYSRWRFSWQVN